MGDNDRLIMENINASAETWRKKGAELWTAQRHEEALRAFEKAIELNPNNAMA